MTHNYAGSWQRLVIMYQMASAKVQWIVETDSELWCSGKSCNHWVLPCQLELQCELESEEPSGILQVILSMNFSQSLWQQSASPSLLLLGGASSTPAITAPGVEMQPCHLSWADPGCTGTGGTLFRVWLGIRWWAIALCIVCFLCSFISVIIIPSSSVILKSLSQTTSFTFFSDSPSQWEK